MEGTWAWAWAWERGERGWAQVWWGSLARCARTEHSIFPVPSRSVMGFPDIQGYLQPRVC